MSQEHLLSKRFPLVFDNDNTEQWVPLARSLVPFMRKVFRKSQHRELVLELLQHVNFMGGTVVEISDRKLARLLEMDRRDVQDAAKDPIFMSMVGVWRGKKRVKGAEPDATDYDLAPLLQFWRQYRDCAEPAEGWRAHFAASTTERNYWITTLLTSPQSPPITRPHTTSCTASPELHRPGLAVRAVAGRVRAVAGRLRP